MNRFVARLVLCLVLAATATAGAAAQAAGAAAPSMNCGAAQTTVLTPNSTSVASSLNNENNRNNGNNGNNGITIAFRTGNVTYWTALLSTSVVSLVLSSDRGNAVVTFKTGLALHLTANGSAGFNIFLSGSIVDDGIVYSITGALLGTFTC